MTREEAIKTLKENYCAMCAYGSQDMDSCDIRSCDNKDAIKALEQEPCEDEYIKVPKKALKYRTTGMVAYNAEWLKNHFDIERAVICGAQEPCEDAISRQAVKEQMIKYGFHAPDMTVTEFVEDLPPVNPQPKTGHWIGDKAYPICFKCNCNIIEEYISCLNYAEMYKPMKYCPNCGCRMIEPQERRKE